LISLYPKTTDMRVLFSFLLVALTSVSCAQNRVSQTEFKKLMKDPSAQIVDVRTANEVAQGKINGSMNIDYFSPTFVATAQKKLDKTKPVLVYCAAGGRSASAAKDLKKAGFKKVYDLEGGYDAWKE
jgi:rhodanese-related sulfurtransferase